MNEGEKLVETTKKNSDESESIRPASATLQSLPRTNNTHPKSNSRLKTAELLGPASNISLGLLFRICGRFIGKFPIPFIIATAIILSSSFGLVGLKLRDNVRDGYTPSTSRARLENQYYRDFLGSEGDPVMTTVLIIAKDNGSMHRPEYLAETVKQWNFISTKLAVEVPDISAEGDRFVQFSDFCGHYCQANAVVSYFSDASKTKSNTPSLPGYSLSYPIATVMGYKLHLERNFFGVTTSDNSSDVTNMKNVKVIALAAMTEVKTLEDFEILGEWELELFRYCREYTAIESNILEIHVIGAEIVDTEMNKDAQKMTPYFIIGFSLMLLFVIGTVFLSAYYYGFGGYRVLFIGFSCALVPTFAIMVTLGLNNLFGNRTNSPMLIMPFLINGIGVNDAFLSLHAWMRQSEKLPPSHKLANVLQEVGPSITTTTLTNVVTFMIGWLSPTEEMSIFCIGCAFALFFAYLFTIIFFAPLLVLSLNKKTGKPKNKNGILKKYLNMYVKIITHKAVFVVLMLGACVYWGFGIMGTISINAKLDTAKILPLDTPIRKPNRLIEEYVWKEFYPVNVLVKHAVNISDSVEMAELDRMINDFESLPNCRGSEFSISWLRDYNEYFFGVAAEDFDYDDENVKNTSLTFDFNKLSGFLENPIYKHHAASIRLDYNKPIPVQSFQLTFVYFNNTSWDDRVDIMTKWRGIVDNYPNLNASVWNVNAMFVDQMLSLKPLASQNVTVTLACMAIVCVIFIQNPTSVVTATLAILSISLGVTGYLSFWHLDLDPVSLCAVLVSIGMAVDFVAHTTYHYQLSYKEKEIDGKTRRIMLNTVESRVSYTLSNIGWPMIQAGISTVLCILPLVHLQNYLPLVFVKTIVLVVIWGLFHGLVLLPAILAQIPLSWFNYNCNNLILGFSSSSSVANEESDSEEDVAQEMQPLSSDPQ